jgi:recombination protein RecT
MANQTLSQHVKGQAQGATDLKTLDQFLNKHKAQFALALPKHMNPDRMIRLALTAFNGNKSLQNASLTSVAASIVMASQMGLEIGVAGQGYLVPYKGQCQFIPGWQGIVDLVGRSGRASVWTGAVFEGDEFDYSLGDSPFVKHKPAGEDDPKKLRFTYAVGRVNGSNWPVIEVWSHDRLRKHFNKYNKVGDKHYANDNWEMYARKIPLLQVCKYMPKSIELNAALAVENAYQSGRTFSMDGDIVSFEPEADAKVIEGATHDSQSEGMTVQEIHDKLSNAKSQDELDDAWSAKGLIGAMSKPDETALAQLYATRTKELAG